MPHLHTQPHGHDVTISAWILRQFPSDGVRRQQWKALVHKHRKMNLWIQPGGHVEHTENPWQALAHELHEETGYSIDQLSVLQPWDRLPKRLPRQDATSPSSTATRTPHSSRCCIRWQPAVSTLAMSPTDFAPSPLTTVLTPTSVALV